MKKIINPLVLALALAAVVYAGMSTQSGGLTLQGKNLPGTTVLSIENGSGTEVFDVNTSGVLDVNGSGSTFAGITLDTNTDLVGAADGTSDLGASGTEIGTAWVQTIDDGDGTVTVAAALEAGGLALDDTTDLTCDADGGCDIGASGTEIGTAWIQTIDDGDGTVTVAASLDTSGGTVALGSNVPTMTTSSYFWIFAEGITCADSNGCAEGEQGGKETRVFADSTTDDTANIWIPLPPDFAEGTSGLHISVLYNMPSGSPTEGEWDVTYLAIADDDADAALGGEVTVLDTPAAADDWNLTSAMVIPTAAITSSDVGVAISLYHDVSDPFGGAVEVAGIKVGYTTDKNY
ncbi:MAG: hypothetical protein VW405_02360 [Rhodospirillaceae bacterium]